MNDEMYRPNKQWLTIVNNRDDKQDNQNSFLKQLNEFDPSRPEDSSGNQKTIIDTFTTNLEDLNEDDTEANTYRVSGEVGTLISQKLLSGDRIRIGRTGESVRRTSGRREKRDRGLNMIDEDANKHVSRLSETSNASNYVSILSWKDQINKNDIKIIEPKTAQVREEKVSDKLNHDPNCFQV